MRPAAAAWAAWCGLLLSGCRSFRHSRCSRAVQVDFQLPDCALPRLADDLPLARAGLVVSHNAATGYVPIMSVRSTSRTNLARPYAKNQVGPVDRQLDDGARALDLRPRLLRNGTVVMRHGGLGIPVTLDAIVGAAAAWCRAHPTELVLLLTSHFDSAAAAARNGSASSWTMTEALAEVYDRHGVRYVACATVAGLTVGEAMSLAALDGGGHLLALDAQDDGGTSCAKENWAPDRLVTCWDRGGAGDSTASCRGADEDAWSRLRAYIVASANGAATDDPYTLGPPSDYTATPLNQIQALWQVDGRAVAQGLLHGSSILQDNRASDVNRRVVELVHSGALQSLGLVALDNVALHGNALASVLRTACGQSAEGALAACGPDLPLPHMGDRRAAVRRLMGALASLYAVASIAYLLHRRPDVLKRIRARLWGRLIRTDPSDVSHEGSLLGESSPMS